MDSVKDARSASFLDLDEDVRFFWPLNRGVVLMFSFSKGTLDIMIQRTGQQGQGNVLFVQNNFYYDAFFLKAIGAL
jgi:integrin alpha FG-GAP repeat containing protein 1